MLFFVSLPIVAVEAQTCDSLVSSFVQVLVNNGFAEPVVSSIGDVTQITVNSDYEPFSFSHIIRKGSHSRTYSFKYISNQYTNMPDSCILKWVYLSFQPIDKLFIEETLLSPLECFLLAEAYNKEKERKDDLIRQRKNYLTLLDSFTESFGGVCSQVHEVLHAPQQSEQI